jgi:hypothetical protein
MVFYHRGNNATNWPNASFKILTKNDYVNLGVFILSEGNSGLLWSDKRVRNACEPIH